MFNLNLVISVNVWSNWINIHSLCTIKPAFWDLAWSASLITVLITVNVAVDNIFLSASSFCELVFHSTWELRITEKKILLGNGCLKHDQIINKEIKSSYFGCYYVFISWQVISLFDLCNSSSLVRSWPWCSPCWCTVKFCVLRSTWTDCRTAVDWPEMERPIANCSGISIYSPNQTIVL